MYKLLNELVVSPSDLTSFLDSEFVTWMDRFRLEFPELVTPDLADEEAELFFKKGDEHEEAYLQSLKAQGMDVCEIVPGKDTLEQTAEAIQSGREIIYQAELFKAPFKGYSDFLFRVDTPSALGDFSYEIGDTKLSRKAKPYHIIQLCCYAEMLETLQGRLPESLRIILGNNEIKHFRTADFYYYYLQVKQAFLKQQETFDPNQRPAPIYGDDFKHWTSFAEAYLEEIDHLSRVANITRTQIRRLEDTGIRTLHSLATTQLSHVPKMDSSIFERLTQQARLQLESKELDKPKYELVSPPANSTIPRFGLEFLPPASEYDVFFDMEGYPLVNGGLEYLFGATYLENNQPCFKDWWAHNETEEKLAFEGFIDWAYGRWLADPSMHIYHYASYEVTAMRKLMGKYGTREHEVDEFLRHEVFVDLYKIVRQGIRVGEPSYSIKNIEHLYMEAREGEVKTAGASVVYYERWLELQDGLVWQASEILKDIRDYNEQDCISTWKLTEWLRNIQQENGITWIPPLKDDNDEAAEDSEEESIKPATELAKRILANIPSNVPQNEVEKWRVHELLAWLLEFHRREQKPLWWAYFERISMTDFELVDEPDCLGMLVRTETPPEPVKRSVLFEYQFDPNQETKLKAGDKCRFVVDETIYTTTIETLLRNEGIAKIKLSQQSLQKYGFEDGNVPKNINLIPYKFQDYKTIEDSIYRTIKVWYETGELPQALEDFLYRRRPRLLAKSEGPLIPDGIDTLDGASNVIQGLDNSALCIQGPPGAGKSYTASRVILELLKRNYTVGITSNSHKAIIHLMEKVAEEASSEGYPLNSVKIRSDKKDGIENNPLVTNADKITSVVIDSNTGYQLVGGTAWAFSHEYSEGKFDYLFVDEAGQVSIANLVGMSPSTKNIVLLGDQMQLSQPIQGAHPGESGQSILEYYLQGHATIPPEKGIFLEKTYRLHPEICEFISQAVYEGRLQSNELETKKQVLTLPTGVLTLPFYKPAGILYLPVSHEGNTQCSEEEVAVIQSVLAELLTCQTYDKNLGQQRPITINDILFVTPYNMQVRMLQEALGSQARVGSVDKFQGQEAPVVIVSMCASSGNDSLRGLEFLLNKNRINVALSRAKSLAIVVGSPTLALTKCTKIDQMTLVNLYCWINECYAAVPQPDVLDNV
jgi:predicted RecB family nuclease